MNIGITGHREKYFKNPERERAYFQKQFRVLLETFFDYKKDTLLNVGGCTGVDMWSVGVALEVGLCFKFWLPFSLKELKNYRTSNEYLVLKECVSSELCVGVNEYFKKYNSRAYQGRNRQIVDNSNILVAYWAGNKRSGTYNCIRYAHEETDVPVVNLRVL